MVKFKNFVFNLSGVLLHVGVLYLLYLSIHGILTDSKGNFIIDWPLGIISTFIILFVIIGGYQFFKFIDKEFYRCEKSLTPFGYIYYFRNLKDRKWIYHSELGYYLFVITANDILLFEPHFFYLKRLYQDYNHGNVDKISEDIKGCLDNRYRSLLNKIQLAKQDKEKINKVKSWDGYLDTQSRRDNKIDKILK